MRVWSEIRYRVRALLASSRMDDELAEELRDHIARDIEARTHDGASPAEARREAAVAFGGMTRFGEETRDVRGGRWLADAAYDLRHGARLLRRYPGFALATILISALGIGATTMVFSAINGVLLRPLPFPDADRIARLVLRSPEGRVAGNGRESYDILSRDNPVLDGVGAYTLGSARLSGGEPEEIEIEYVTPSLLRLLRVQPRIGRVLADEDAERGAPVVLLSHGFWMRRFAGDSGVVGRTIALDRVAHTIVGVTAPDFTGPFLDGRDVWLPIRMSPQGAHLPGGRVRAGTIIVRLKAGVTPGVAESWLNSVIERRVVPPIGGDTVTARASLIPVLEQIVGDVRQPLLILLGAVGFVLVLVATNVASLVLARSLVREREMAVRGALGASRGRLIRQVLSEIMLLAGLGGLLGLAIAWLGVQALVGQGVSFLPRLADITIDWRVAVCAAAVTFVTGVAGGLAPAIGASRGSLSGPVAGEGLRSTAGAGRARLRAILVAAEVAVSVVLLVGAGLLVKGFLRVAASPPGYAVSDRAAVQVELSDPARSTPRTPESYLTFMNDVRRRMGGVSGVRDVAVTPFAPLVRSTIMAPVTRNPGGDAEASANGHFRMITANYFVVMEIPLVAGRAFTDADDRGGALVAIVNESAAEQWWPGESPIGRQLRYELDGVSPASVAVVGVARDTRYSGRSTASRPEVFLPFAQHPVRSLTFIAHTPGGAERVLDALERSIWEVDPELPIGYAGTLEEIASDSVREQRFYVTMLTTFAGIALLLASMGIFSVVTYAVSQRTREIGIRLALGAPRRSVVGMILRQGLLIAGSGLLIGVVAARSLTRFLESLLVEVAPTDASVFVAAFVGVCGVALLACAMPLRRALSVDPAGSLKADQ